ncbi:MAG: hypothetical protein ABF913_04875 [Oenococcus sp.]|uniref:hypothetical protein n=1 Tax=Oenococcus sp. TaxID=1979414 RepID=UPI0039EC9734
MKYFDEVNKKELEDVCGVSNVIAQAATIQDYAQLLELAFKTPDEFYFWLDHLMFNQHKHYKTFEDVIENELPANEVTETLNEAIQNADTSELVRFALDYGWLTEYAEA